MTKNRKNQKVKRDNARAAAKNESSDMSQDNNNSEPGLPSVAVEPARRTHSRKHGRQFYNRPWNSNNYGPPMFFPCPNGSPGPGYMGYYYIDIPRMAPSTNVGYPVFDPWGYNHWQLVDSNPFAGYQRIHHPPMIDQSVDMIPQHFGKTYFAEKDQEVESFRYQGLRPEAPEFVPMRVRTLTEGSCESGKSSLVE